MGLSNYVFMTLYQAVCFRQWCSGLKDAPCPWYIAEEYYFANNHARRVRRSRATPDPKQTDANADHLDTQLEGGEAATETEPGSDDEAKMKHIDPDADDRIMKMLYKGNIEEANRKEAQTRKSHCVSHKHNVYRHTRCTSAAQEEQSALPAGVNIRLFISPSPFHPRHAPDRSHFYHVLYAVAFLPVFVSFSMMFCLRKKSIYKK